MNDQVRAASTEELLRATTSAQLDASDPRASAWVGANAGAGKTHVLKMRVLRLLLAGVAPERILCLTYTKAAAAEMAQRVFRELAGWSTMASAALNGELIKVLGREPSPDEQRGARQLFARAIETPGGLKVQTIHAFCERLLQRFPLEANVPPGFAILDDATAAGLMRDAVDDALVAANAAPDGPMGQAVRAAIAFAADEQFDKVLTEALGKRDWISELSRFAAAASRGDINATEALRQLYLKAFELTPGDTDEALLAQLASVLSEAQLQSAERLLLAGSTNDQKLGASVRSANKADGIEQRVRALEALFLTSEKPRSDKTFITKASRAAEPGLADAMLSAKAEFARLHDRRRRRRIVDATVALLTIAERVMAHYTNAKSQRAALDFDDLIAHSASLLDQSNAAAWVLYKLDGGLDHVLVDEAQDTSPIQWRVIEQLVSEFYAGAGVREETGGQTGDGLRSVFAVGDEKQSIYSFQGAAPEMFAKTGLAFEKRALAAEQVFRRVPLMLSFRTVTPLLDAVDRVFGDHGRTPGLSASTTEIVQHLALRQGQAGQFELWDTEAVEEVEAAPAFAPLEEQAVSSPITRLAERIANQIETWLTTEERLQSQDRPVRASDILVLVRKRQPFAAEMVRALKRRQIPVAGADRIVLGEHIAVQDLMALADFLLLPEDDLALANVLKSPFFNLDDDDLLRFAPERPGLLWTALLRAADTDAALAPAATQLKRWRAQADFSPPFEFFANLLDRDGGRARLLSRLGPEAADAIDEFINLALNYDEQAPPSLQGFVTWLRAGRREIKRDMEHGRDEVRVMTVHGSKGLEAPIVFLPDTCSAPGAGQPSPLVELDRDRVRPGFNEVLAWAIRGAGKSGPVEEARNTERAERLKEHNRLLYVAMTRARDRLYVGGFEGKTGVAPGSWYETIEAGLEGQLAEAKDHAGRRVRRLEVQQTKDHEPASFDALAAHASAPVPPWVLQPAPKEPVLTVPLAPSRIETGITDAEGDWASLSEMRDQMLPPLEPASPSPLYLARADRLLRGTITHALLEHLPTIAEADRADVGRRFVDARGPELPEIVRAEIVMEALHILGDERFGEAFGPQSRAEVAIVANISHPTGQGPTLRVNGQIDRLVRRKSGVLIVDYKSNRHPPASPEAASQAYLLQLAAYRIAVQQIFPGETVETAFLWTDRPLLMPVPASVLDAIEPRLWDVAI